MFSSCPPISSTNKTDRHDIIDILLKVALNTIKQTNLNSRDGNKYPVNRVLARTADYRIPKSVFGYSENFFMKIMITFSENKLLMLDIIEIVHINQRLAYVYITIIGQLNDN